MDAGGEKLSSQPMKLTHLSVPLFILTSLFTIHYSAPAAEGSQGKPTDPQQPPNFVVIMADDLGYAELGCYGSKTFKTPHIDALAEGGLRLTDFHSNGAVCSPTRAALLTGRYQQRSGIDGVVTAKGHRHTGLGLEQETVAEMLKRAGYATGMFGKWHVGYDPKFNPSKQGFDQFHGFVSGNIDLFSHVDQEGWFDWWVQDQLTYTPGYAPHHITERGIEFIRQHKDRPFLLYLPHPAPHYPYQGPMDQANRVVKKGFKPEQLDKLATVPALKKAAAARAYREMVQDLDAQVGRIIAELQSQGLRKNTLVIFCSDNGGTGNKELGSSNAPLRGKKGQLYEGGHRVAGIFNWPGKIKPQVSTETVLTFDLMPTFAELAGVVPEATMDGVSLKSLLLDHENLAKRPLIWMTGKSTAYRQGDWKLLLGSGRKLPPSPLLYNLRQDLGETTDLAAQYPERVKTMQAAALHMRNEIRDGSQMLSGQ